MTGGGGAHPGFEAVHQGFGASSGFGAVHQGFGDVNPKFRMNARDTALRKLPILGALLQTLGLPPPPRR